MLEVRPGLLLGSMGDALAVFSRVPSVLKQYHVTHVLTLCNNPPEWAIDTEPEGKLMEQDEEEKEKEEDEDKREAPNEVPCDPEKEAEEEEEDKDDDSLETNSKREKRKKQQKKKKKRGRQVELPKWKKFIEVADMPESDLLHHFESCCQFIRGARERGTILVHCEHGVSRSVTVVLAYLMWSERRSLKLLYQEMKEKKPEIRPNSGFMNQLRLWEDMGCQLKEDNKKYRAYCLQCKAREIKATGQVEEVKMAPDPSSSPIDAGLYFRCRKCRQLLFTDRDILQHELGQGRGSFDKHGGKKPPQRDNSTIVMRTAKEGSREEDEMPKRGAEVEKENGGEREKVLTEELKENGGSSLDLVNEGEEEMSKKREDEHDVQSQLVILGGNPNIPTAGLLKDHTPLVTMETEASVMRREIGSIRARQAALSLSPSCTSYFIEPVAWMGDALLGHIEGKILCPKCNSRLGSFSWKGQQCSCGRWLTPAFQVHKNRVDEIRTLSKRKSSSSSNTTS